MFTGKTDAKKNTTKRHKVKPENGEKSLLNYVGLFFQPRNPMMYRAIFEKGEDKLAVLEIANAVLNLSGFIIADGNSLDPLTRFYPSTQG